MHRFFWVFLALGLFLLYSYLALASAQGQGIFNSPDETANAYFIEVFQESRNLRVNEPLLEAVENQLHPRSVTVREGALVPESFHGLPVIYGLLGWGKAWMYLTALFAVLALLAWRRTIARIFNQQAGDFTALLLAITPAWWYWTSRGLYHNVFFVALLIFAAYFFIAKPISTHFARKEPLIDAAMAGIMLGLALWVRTAEILWVLVMILVLLAAFARKVRKRQVIVFFVAAVIAFLPALAFNQTTYGHPLVSGYTVDSPQLGGGGSEAVGDDTSMLRGVEVLLPFGFHPRVALNNFIQYFLALPSWMTTLTVLTLIWFALGFLREIRTRRETALIILFLGVTGWLAIVYGSWVIHDNPDPNAITIGISYSRYWLPGFVLGSAIGGLGLAALQNKLKSGFSKLPFVIIIFLAVLSFQNVFLTKGDGLVDVGNTLGEYARVKEDVVRRTSKQAVIVVDRGDKIFFPERRVIREFRDDSTLPVLRSLFLRVPLYYYNLTIKTDDLMHQNNVRLKPYGLRLQLKKTYNDSSLYEFVEALPF